MSVRILARPMNTGRAVSHTASRLLVDSHEHEVHNDRSGTWDTITVAAVLDEHGGHVEIGQWSLLPSDARLLALSLTTLADAAEAS